MHEQRLILTDAPPAALERLEPRAKLFCLAVWVVCVVTVPAGHHRLLSIYALLLAILLALNLRLAGKFLQRFAPAVPAIFAAALLLPFFKEGEVLWRLGPLAATRPGINTGLRVAAVASLCVAAVALVWASTRQDLLLQGLRGVGLPALFVNVLAFMLRYLEVLRPELHRLTDARAARTIARRRPSRLGSSANLIGVLFLRAHDRAERVADAMAARGYTGTLHTFHKPHFHTQDLVTGASFAATVVALRIAVTS
jgi:cobalt/nickel transport system permease protein